MKTLARIIGQQSEPSVGGGGGGGGVFGRKHCIAGHTPIWCIYICVCVSCIHNPEIAWKILRTRLKNRNGRLDKFAIYTLSMSMMKKMAADFKAEGKKPGPTCSLLAVLP